MDWLRSFGAPRATDNARRAIERRHQQEAVVESLTARLEVLARPAPPPHATVA